MPAVIYPYTVTNSYKGGLFMRTYSRNVRRAWDGEDYRPPKRLCLDDQANVASSSFTALNKENSANPIDFEDSLERAIRETSVAALSSSPSRKNSTIFSLESHEDDNHSSTATPPSSPPPTLHLTPPNVKQRKPTFSFLDKNKKEKDKGQTAKRKHDVLSGTTSTTANRPDETEPLSEIMNSSSRPQNLLPASAFTAVNNPPGVRLVVPESQPSQVESIHPAPKPPPSKQNLVQCILDFGQPLVPTTCPQCQMSYMASVPEDQQLHNMFHNRHSSGIELGKAFLKSAMKWCYEVSHIPGSVVVVDRKISVPGRKAVHRVLEVVNKELGSVDISEDDLWSQKVLEGDEEGKKCDRYKAFLHVMDGKCVGVCLAERITKACRVLPTVDNNPTITIQTPDVASGKHTAEVDASDVSVSLSKEITPAVTADVAPEPPKPRSATVSSSSISTTDASFPAVVGVSRIWTSKAFRRKGIANNLLECVMNQFIYGMEIERAEVAFSQPTESGGLLARSWFGEEDGWAVYRED